METTYLEDMMELLAVLEDSEKIIPEKKESSSEFKALAVLRVIPELASVDSIFHDFPDSFSEEIKNKYTATKNKLLNKLDME